MMRAFMIIGCYFLAGLLAMGYGEGVHDDDPNRAPDVGFWWFALAFWPCVMIYGLRRAIIILLGGNP